jgi:DNA-binding NtrC family response regulator
MFLDVLQNPDMVTKNQTFINELKDIKGHELMQHVPTLPAGRQVAIGSQPGIQSSQPVILNNDIQDHVEVEESLNIMDKEKELIIKALKKHRSKRKDAALDLGISERTLYRKLKEYNIEE